jgi:type IV fimbrial biogenesis protein FimT
MRAHQGFTLIELMVTVAVLAVLMMIAVPSFVTFIQNARLSSQSSDLTTALMYARSEAVARNRPVSVCAVPSSFSIANCPTPTNPAAAPGANCACSGVTSWEPGYAVFVDANSNGTIDTGDTVLRAYQTLAGNNTLRGPNAFVTFTGNGYSSGFSGNMRLCDSRGTNNSRRIVLTNQGRSLYCSCDATSASPPACSSSTVYSAVSANAGCATACP